MKMERYVRISMIHQRGRIRQVFDDVDVRFGYENVNYPRRDKCVDSMDNVQYDVPHEIFCYRRRGNAARR